MWNVSRMSRFQEVVHFLQDSEAYTYLLRQISPQERGVTLMPLQVCAVWRKIVSKEKLSVVM